MNELSKAETHTIFPAERLGDTLVVIPHGDLTGFAASTFHTEFRRLQAVLADTSLKNLIIDLSNSRYFGSEMIGAFIALREIVIPRGRAALTNVSPDMQVGLDIIGAPQLFETFPSRAEAVHELATLTVGERVHRHRRPLRWIFGLMLFAFVAWGLHASKVGYQLFGSRTARAYDVMAREWQKYDAGRQRWTVEEGRTYRSQTLGRLGSLEKSLRTKSLFPVSEDRWLREAVGAFRTELRGTSAENQLRFFRKMRFARNNINHRTGLNVRLLGPPNIDLSDEEESSDQAESSEEDDLADEAARPALHDDAL